jgi:creatinine amidohydrolase/Fe(II)-dependent formamide hydrolase-like protein
MLVEHMTWEEYRDEVSRRIIILPVGSLEQHGPHLPLNVDVVIPTSLAKYEHVLLGDSLDAEELSVAVEEIATIADEYYGQVWEMAGDK